MSDRQGGQGGQGPRMAAGRTLGRPAFLEREVYRKRRLIDALRLLPALGVILFVFPALIQDESGGSTAGRLIYFFVVWVGLIGLCAVLVRLRPKPSGPTGTSGPPEPPILAERR